MTLYDSLADVPALPTSRLDSVTFLSHGVTVNISWQEPDYWVVQTNDQSDLREGYLRRSDDSWGIQVSGVQPMDSMHETDWREAVGRFF